MDNSYGQRSNSKTQRYHHENATINMTRAVGIRKQFQMQRDHKEFDPLSPSRHQYNSSPYSSRNLYRYETNKTNGISDFESLTLDDKTTDVNQSERFMDYPYESYRGKTRKYMHQNGTLCMTQNIGIKQQFQMQRDGRGHREMVSFDDQYYSTSIPHTTSYPSPTPIDEGTYEFDDDAKMKELPTPFLKDDHRGEYKPMIELEESKSSEIPEAPNTPKLPKISSTVKPKKSAKSTKPKARRVTEEKKSEESNKPKTVIVTDGEVHRVGGGYTIPEVLGKMRVDDHNEEKKEDTKNEKPLQLAWNIDMKGRARSKPPARFAKRTSLRDRKKK